MSKFRCKECRDEFSDRAEADFHSYDAHNMEYEDCIEEIEETENLAVIEENPEETPIDEGLTEEEFDEKKILGVLEKAFENDYFTEEEKHEVMSRLMGMETGHDKKFPVKPTTKDLCTKSYKAYIEDLADPESQICRFCGQEWSRISEEEKVNLEKESLSFAKQHKSLQGKFSMIRVYHCKAKHPAIWKFIQYLFGVPKKSAYPDKQKTFVSNPEHCSENLENLSKEELAEKIGGDPELRKAFFKKWLLHLKKKK